MAKQKKEARCKVRGSRNVDGKIKVDYDCEGRDGEMKPKTACIDEKTGKKVRCPREQ